MILLTIIIGWVMLIRWQVRHVHNDRTFSYLYRFRFGDRLKWRGYNCTAIDVKQYDMVIRIDLIELFRRPFCSHSRQSPARLKTAPRIT